MGVTKNDRIYVAGHTGMVGSAILRKLREAGYQHLLLRERSELDLLNQEAVSEFFDEFHPQYVILAAAKVGGIQANIDDPVGFLLDNLKIQSNVITQAYLNGIEQLVFLGSSCIYPRNCPQPMKEEHLLSGPLEPTNEGYALAKITGLKLLEYYYQQYGFKSISLVPCNLYGTNDNFDTKHAHVLSSLVKKFSDALSNQLDQVTIWGSGVAQREFMHVDDLADATLYFMERETGPDFINVGWGKAVSIQELARLIAEEIGFTGQINWDHSKPDGMIQKCMDVSRMKAAGFEPIISLTAGIRQTIQEYAQLNPAVR